jgi:signal transduction histidine kinase
MLSEPQAPPADAALCAPETAEVIRHLAQDLRNPLNSIEQIGFYLEMSVPPADSRSRRRLAALHRQVRQASWMLEDALLFAESGSSQPALVDLAEVVGQVVSHWRSGTSAWLCLQMEEGLPPVLADIRQVEHLVRNVLLFLAADTRRATRVRCYEREGQIAVEFAPPGPVEVPPELLGTSDGMAFSMARRILKTHGARFEVLPAGSERIMIRLTFPVAAA